VRLPTDIEMDDHQHFILVSDVDWEPSVLDNKIYVNGGKWYPDTHFIGEKGINTFYALFNACSLIVAI
jgi:hypothetical protein